MIKISLGLFALFRTLSLSLSSLSTNLCHCLCCLKSQSPSFLSLFYVHASFGLWILRNFKPFFSSTSTQIPSLSVSLIIFFFFCSFVLLIDSKPVCFLGKLERKAQQGFRDRLLRDSEHQRGRFYLFLYISFLFFSFLKEPEKNMIFFEVVEEISTLLCYFLSCIEP